MILYLAIVLLALATATYGSIADKLHHGNLDAALRTRETPQAQETVPSQQNESNLTCGTGPPDQEFKDLLKNMAEGERGQPQKRSETTDATNKTIVVDAHVHIVTNEGRTVQQQREAQIPALMEGINENFASAGFRFDLQSVNVTVNRAWSRGRGGQHRLRKGNYSALNIYIVDGLDILNNGAAGISSIPRRLPLNARSFVGDGTTIRASRISTSYTATHEIGHWLGLLHTYEGGCAEDGRDPGGDFVFDTPAHIEQGFSVHACADGTADTCPLLPGLDPVKNFMNFVKDGCANEFTFGQGLRMKNLWKETREPHRVAPADASSSSSSSTTSNNM